MAPVQPLGNWPSTDTKSSHAEMTSLQSFAHTGSTVVFAPPHTGNDFAHSSESTAVRHDALV